MKTTWSPSRALRLCRLSAEVYKEPEAISLLLQNKYNYKFHFFKFFSVPGTDTQFFIAEDLTGIYIVFRGTEVDKIKDWFTDFNILLTQIGSNPDVKVHQGFKIAAMSAIAEINRHQKILSTLRQTKKPILITGHSLGASLSIIFGFYLSVLHEIKANEIYAFEPARPGNNSFSHLYPKEIKVWSHFNHRDIVPRMAPRALGYRHVGKWVYIDANGEVHLNPKWWSIELNRIFQGRIEALFERGIDDFEDHKVEKVMWSIFKHIEKAI